MAQDISFNPIAGDKYFPAADYFLGLAQRTISSGANTRITLEGKGEVSVYPARREYTANIPDAAEFFQAPAAQFKTTPLGETDKPQSPQHIGDLLWQAGFHASQGRLLEGTTKYDIVQLSSWPNLTRLSKTPNTMRICALLTRNPTTIMLTNRLLGIDKEEVYSVYSAAYSAGIAHIRNLESTTHLRAYDPATLAASQEEEAVAPVQEKGGMFRSLFSKISGL